MDDFLEILIYFLFILASILGSVYRSQQKKKEMERRKQMMPSSSDEEPVQMDKDKKMPQDVFPPIFDYEPEIVEEEELSHDVYVEPETEEQPVEVSIESQVEGTAAFQSTDSELLSDDMQEEGEEFDLTKHLLKEYNFEKTENEDESQWDFDPVKAVIYSEILNRKEY